MLYVSQEPATGKLTQAELDDYIEPWHLPHYIRQVELERKQRDLAAAPADAAHPVTDFCHADHKPQQPSTAALQVFVAVVSASIACALLLHAWRAIF